MHPFRQHILKKLTLADKLRFSDLKPERTESNLFVYHLKSLIREGYVRKSSAQYVLTALGKRYVDKLSLQSFQPRFQPKIVTVIVCKNATGEYLVCKSSRQPFFGKWCFPYGKIHFGESIEKAAHRELREKTNLSAKLKHRGDVYLTVYSDSELVTHMLCHVFQGSACSGELQPPSRVASDFGALWKRIGRDDSPKFIPGFLEMAKLAQGAKTRFFKELVFT